MKASWGWACAMVLGAAPVAACGGEPVERADSPFLMGKKKPTSASEAQAEPEAASPLSPLSDEAFASIDGWRDPFRSYVTTLKVDAPQAPQRRVIMPDTSVEEMRLVAIVTGIARPRAMLVDGLGIGHVVERGVFIGRPEVVRSGADDAVPVTLNWRVDRIRRGELVLSREDPTDPAQPPLTRVIPLHESGLTAEP